MAALSLTSWYPLCPWTFQSEIGAWQRFSLWTPKRIFFNQDLSSERLSARRNLCQHLEKRLETWLGNQTYISGQCRKWVVCFWICLWINLFIQTIKCLLIVPNPESALNEEAGKLLLEQYEDYFQRAKMMTEIHAKVSQQQVQVYDVQTLLFYQTWIYTGQQWRPVERRHEPNRRTDCIKESCYGSHSLGRQEKGRCQG